MPPIAARTPRTTTLARSIARRSGRAVFINTLGTLLAFALPAGVVLVAAVRFWLEASWWFTLPIGILILALLVSAIHAARSWWSVARAAGEGDRQLGLRDELRNAVELDDSPDPFARLAVESAEARAAGLESSSMGFPIHRGAWIVAGLALAATLAAGLWTPPMRRGAPDSLIARVETDRATRALDTARQLLDQAEEPEATNPRVREALDELNALEDELLKQPEAGVDAPARAAAKLDELANELERDAQEQERLQNELADRLSEQANDRLDGSPSSPLDEFSEALSDQDYETAREALEDLREQSATMNEADREAIRKQFEELANAIEPDNTNNESQSPPEQEPATPTDAQQPKRDTGPESSQDPMADPEADPAADPPADPTSDSPQGQQPTPDQPQDPAPERTPSERLADALREEAERMNNESEQNQLPGEQAERQNPTDQPPPSNPDDQEPGDQQGADSQQNKENNPTEQGAEQGEQENPQRGSEPQPEQASESTEPANEQEGSQQESTGQEGSESDRGEPSPQQGDQPTSDEQEGQRPNPGENSPSGEDGQSMDEVLREMEGAKQRSDRQRQDAEDLRQVARELIDPQQSPPDGQPQGVKPNQESADPNGPSPAGNQPADTNQTNTPLDPNDQPEYIPVDGRKPGETDNARKAGEWYAPDDPDASPTDRARSAERLREAANSAKRAVDNQQIPRRYRELIRDVYKRVEKRADEAEKTTTIQPGRDADPAESPP